MIQCSACQGWIISANGYIKIITKKTEINRVIFIIRNNNGKVSYLRSYSTTGCGSIPGEIAAVNKELHGQHSKCTLSLRILL